LGVNEREVERNVGASSGHGAHVYLS